MKYIIFILITIIFLLSAYIMFDDQSTELVPRQTSKQTVVVPNNKDNELKTSIRFISLPKERKLKFKQEVKVENSNTNLTQRDLLQLLGNEKALKWQEEYEKGDYEPDYDITWKDDMLSQSYNLISEEKYAGKMEISNFQCEEDECTIDMADVSSGIANMGDYADFMLDLKNQPAILKSGKNRNVYLSSIVVNKEGRAVKISIK